MPTPCWWITASPGCRLSPGSQGISSLAVGSSLGTYPGEYALPGPCDCEACHASAALRPRLGWKAKRIKKLLQRWARSYMFSRCCVNIMQCLERVLSSAQTLVTSKNSLGSTTPLDNLESWIHPPCGLVPSLDHFPNGFVQKMEQLNVHSFRIGLPRDKPNGPNSNQTWLTGKRSNGSPKFIQLEHHPQWGVFNQVMFDYQRVPLTTWDFTNLYGCLGPSRVKVHVWLDFVQGVVLTINTNEYPVKSHYIPSFVMVHTEKIHGLVGGFNHFLFPIIYGMSSFPLTNSYFSRCLLHHQPDYYCII